MIKLSKDKYWLIVGMLVFNTSVNLLGVLVFFNINGLM
jgi:hypothetical protein